MEADDIVFFKGGNETEAGEAERKEEILVWPGKLSL